MNLSLRLEKSNGWRFDMDSKILKNIIAAIAFVVFLGMVIYGQKTVGVGYLAIQLVGLSGLLFLLYLYNRKYQ